MIPTIALSARVVVPGVPPNWPNERGHHMKLHARRQEWKDRAWMCAQSARNEAGWPLPERTAFPTPRYVEISVYKRSPLYDGDGAMAALKPVIDGIVGVLLVDDSPAWSALLTAPADLQWPVASRAAEQVVITVHLVDPR